MHSIHFHVSVHVVCLWRRQTKQVTKAKSELTITIIFVITEQTIQHSRTDSNNTCKVHTRQHYFKHSGICVGSYYFLHHLKNNF